MCSAQRILACLQFLIYAFSPVVRAPARHKMCIIVPCIYQLHAGMRAARTPSPDRLHVFPFIYHYYLCTGTPVCYYMVSSKYIIYFVLGVFLILGVYPSYLPLSLPLPNLPQRISW